MVVSILAPFLPFAAPKDPCTYKIIAMPTTAPFGMLSPATGIHNTVATIASARATTTCRDRCDRISATFGIDVLLPCSLTSACRPYRAPVREGPDARRGQKIRVAA